MTMGNGGCLLFRLDRRHFSHLQAGQINVKRTIVLLSTNTTMVIDELL
jgi:hypothetical protein